MCHSGWVCSYVGWNRDFPYQLCMASCLVLFIAQAIVTIIPFFYIKIDGVFTTGVFFCYVIVVILICVEKEEYCI